MQRIMKVLVIGLISFVGSVFADIPVDGFYIAAQGGLAFVPKLKANLLNKTTNAKEEFSYKYKTVFKKFDVAIGYKNSPLRYELEGGFMNMDLEIEDSKGSTNVISGMVNALYDFQELSMDFTPFVGGGIGYAQLETKGNDLAKGKGGAFAYQGKVGVAYHFSSELSGTLTYKYMGTSNIKHMGDKMFQNHSINIGLVWYAS